MMKMNNNNSKNKKMMIIIQKMKKTMMMTQNKNKTNNITCQHKLLTIIIKLFKIIICLKDKIYQNLWAIQIPT